MRRFTIPKIGDSKRVRPLVDSGQITLAAPEGKDSEAYYCLPVFCYNSQSTELYVTKELEGAGGLLAKLYELIEAEDFSAYDIIVETIGAPEQLGKSYVDGKGIIKISNIKKSIWPITRYEMPRLDEIQTVVEEYEKQKSAWKIKYGK